MIKVFALLLCVCLLIAACERREIEGSAPVNPQERRSDRLIRYEDRERGVTCYRTSSWGGIWCYHHGERP